MARGRRRGPWTPDPARLARALARPGSDLREWVCYGTVASVTGDDGGPDYEDEDAINISPIGVEVDVILEPHGYPLTARWGIQSGRVYISTPIHPGDQVMVILPGGDPSMVPEIVRIITCPHNPIPVGPDGLPLFKNDRALIYAEGVPIDLRTDGGARVLIDNGQVIMNEGDRGVARREDAVRVTLTTNDIAALATRMVAAGYVAPGTPPIPPAPPPPLDVTGEITGGSDTVKAG